MNLLAKQTAAAAAGTLTGGAADSIEQFSPDALQELPLQALIDAFGPLDEQHRANKIIEKKHESYRKEIERRFGGLSPDATTVVAGTRYQVSIGPKAVERKIFDNERCFNEVRKVAGIDALKAMFTPLLSELDKLVPVAKQLTFLKSERTGRRPVEAVARQAAA